MVFLEGKIVEYVAHILHFKNNIWKQEKETGFLKLFELEQSTITICKVIKQVHFKEDFNLLKPGKC